MEKQVDQLKQLKDPFGSQSALLDYITNSNLDLQALYLINETKGRFYLNSLMYNQAKSIPYNTFDLEKLEWCIGIGSLIKKKMGECGKQNLQFPTEKLNQSFIDWLNQSDPLRPTFWYVTTILFVYEARFALESMNIPQHPDLDVFLLAISANTEDAKRWRALWQQLYPNVPIPSTDQAWLGVNDKIEKLLKGLGWKFRNTLGTREEATQEANIKFLDIVNKETAKNFELLLDAGLADKLEGYFGVGVRNDLIEVARTENPQFAKLWQKAKEVYKPKTKEERLKLLNRVKNLRGKIQWEEPLDPSEEELFNSVREKLISAIAPLSLDKEIENNDGDSYCLEDMIADIKVQRLVETIDEGIDLKNLGLDLDKLSPKERWVMQDVYQALQEGYDFSSKQDRSFMERWGEDYDKNIKAYNRGKKRLK